MVTVYSVLEVADFISGEFEKIQNGDGADGDSSEIIARLDVFLKEIKGEIMPETDYLKIILLKNKKSIDKRVSMV